MVAVNDAVVVSRKELQDLNVASAVRPDSQDANDHVTPIYCTGWPRKSVLFHDLIVSEA